MFPNSVKIFYNVKFLIIFLFVFLVSGCAPVLVGTCGIATVVLWCRDKRVGTSMNDTVIETSISKKLNEICHELANEVSVIVDRGVVVMAGRARDPSYVSSCEKAAWSVSGVMAVHNNIVCGDPVEISVHLNDSYITTKAKSSILFLYGSKSLNLKLETVEGVVYVLGVAGSAKELDDVLDAVGKVSGVAKVVSYVAIGDNELVAYT
jgi:osmotically-inducible protein OsmY